MHDGSDDRDGSLYGHDEAADGRTSPPAEGRDDASLNGHKRSLSGSILSKLSFLRASAEDNQLQAEEHQPAGGASSQQQSTSPPKSSLAQAVAAQQKTRRRRGSLRKAALLGRGAQREKRELENSPLKTTSQTANAMDGSSSPMSTSPEDAQHPDHAFGLSASNSTTDARDPYIAGISPPQSSDQLPTTSATRTSPTLTYVSTTDEEDMLTLPHHRSDPPSFSSSDSYFPASANSLSRRRSTQKVSSPLSLGGMAVNVPAVDDDWDYAATEWWGWVILIMTWLVFVIGMGSCLGVWSWAWDVGETPSAPLELSDDHTLPVVGYYPALIILTSVMAWVWVVVAWVGMKYFRHAKISGD